MEQYSEHWKCLYAPVSPKGSCVCSASDPFGPDSGSNLISRMHQGCSVITTTLNAVSQNSQFYYWGAASNTLARYSAQGVWPLAIFWQHTGLLRQFFLHYKALYGKGVKLLLHSLLLHSLHRSRSRTLLMIDFHLLHVSSIWLITCTIHTAASHPERGVFTDPGIPGVLRQLAHTLWTLWVINLTRRERLYTCIVLYPDFSFVEGDEPAVLHRN